MQETGTKQKPLFSPGGPGEGEMMQQRGIDTTRVVKSEPETIQKFRHTALQIIDNYLEHHKHLSLDGDATSLSGIVVSDSVGGSIAFTYSDEGSADLVSDCSDEYPDCAANEFDCNGECGGEAKLDDCGVCSGGNSGHEADSDIDCSGECFGG